MTKKAKINTTENLNASDLLAKQKSYVKELVASKVSMDLSAIKSAANVQNLLRELKNVTRALAIKTKAQRGKS